MKRGRPPTCDKDAVIAAVIAHKLEVIIEGGKIVSKKDKVWKVLSNELNNALTPNALFSFVVNNRYKVRDLLNPSTELSGTKESVRQIESDTAYSELDSTVGSLDNDNDEERIEITFDKAELEELIVMKQYGRSEKHRPQIPFREFTVLQPGKWQEAVTQKLWNTCKKKCGYQFKRNKIYNKKVEIFGKCNCGSVIRGSIDRLDFKADENTMKCVITRGSGTCGKRWLRNPIRMEVGQLLYETNKTAEVHRAAEARRLMLPNDPEPPHLYTADALRKAKEDYQSSLTLHKHPVTSILLAQLSSMKYVVHNLGLNPFYVHYWSNLQSNIYRQYAISEIPSVAIDATGGIINKIVRPDGSKSKHIFLYTCVVNSTEGEKFPITQMLSESQTTNSIMYWLIEWTRSGAPLPKEVVCDSSKALLTAAIRTFTNCSSIDEYADKCWPVSSVPVDHNYNNDYTDGMIYDESSSDMPACYIRIDVAHFIKGYANFLKIANNPMTKKFYMACIGRIILTRDIRDAGVILFAILVISTSETDGSLEDGQLSSCSIQKSKMKGFLLTNTLENLDGDAANDDETSGLEDLGDGINRWYDWATIISQKVSAACHGRGDSANAYYLPQLAARIMRDIKWLPLWSGVCRDQFGYGRMPASSAAVEAEFNNIKSRLLANVTLPIRADVFLKTHVEHIDGQLKIVGAKKQATNIVTPDLIETSINTNTAKAPIVNEQCPACARGDAPTGAHTCIICEALIHAIDSCSTAVPGEEDGYGQKRLCRSCSKIPATNVEHIIDSGREENWRGLSTQPRKKKARYLHTNYTENEFLLHDKIKKVPILKNGSSLVLKSTNLKGKKVTLSNTCAFDSLYQIFLTAVFDSAHFSQECHALAEKNTFFNMVGDSSKKGITQHTYRLRTETLIAIFPANPTPYNTYFVECAVTVGYLCSQLFKLTPSLNEISSCDEGCPPRVKTFPTVPVHPEYFLLDDFSKTVEDNFLLSGASHCCQKNCVSIETTATPTTARFIICDVCDPDNPDTTTELRKVPMQMKLSFMAQPYNLRGVVHWIPPGPNTRRSDPLKAIGHYSPLCFRPDETWIRYDDTTRKDTHVSPDFPANIQIVIYSV